MHTPIYLTGVVIVLLLFAKKIELGCSGWTSAEVCPF